MREVQILSILIFVDYHESQINNEIKEDNEKGIIEEILPKEGKSIIISCISVYFGLRNHKVDIITSSKALAEKDFNKFNFLYKIFGLKVDFIKNDFDSEPYQADILYGTFSNFEEDLLKEMAYNKNIRGERNFDILIIDDFDKNFIESINKNIELKHSLKGSNFLAPLYLSIYLFINIFENVYLKELFNKIESGEYQKNFFHNFKNSDISKNTLNYILKIYEVYNNNLDLNFFF